MLHRRRFYTYKQKHAHAHTLPAFKNHFPRFFLLLFLHSKYCLSTSLRINYSIDFKVQVKYPPLTEDIIQVLKVKWIPPLMFYKFVTYCITLLLFIHWFSLISCCIFSSPKDTALSNDSSSWSLHLEQPHMEKMFLAEWMNLNLLHFCPCFHSAPFFPIESSKITAIS